MLATVVAASAAVASVKEAALAVEAVEETAVKDAAAPANEYEDCVALHGCLEALLKEEPLGQKTYGECSFLFA